MTTPGGVPNLPLGSLTVQTLHEQLQILNGASMRKRAGERMPQIFGASTGGHILNDLSPYGILTAIWAEIYALIANADPADIQGPADIPELLINFIEDLPVIGQLVALLQALLGNYDGQDPTLLEIQALFAPVRALVDAFGQLVGDDLTKLAGFLDGFNIYDPVNSSTRLINQILDLVIEEFKRRLNLPDGGDLPDGIPTVKELARQLLGLPIDTARALDITSIGGWAKDLLSVNSKNIPASGIRGTLSPGVFDIIPVGALSANQPNMITMSRFEDAADIVTTDGWYWDGVTNYTDDTGALAFDVTSTGTRDLVSDQNIGVSPEDQLTLSVWVKTSTAPVSPATTPAAYAGTGSPIKIFIVPYSGANPLTPIEITSRGGTSGAWTQLSGTYTIPKVFTNQITSVHFMLRVTTAATAGVVWFDGISLTKTGLIGLKLVPAIGQMMSGVNVTGATAFGQVVKTVADKVNIVPVTITQALQGIFDPPSPYSGSYEGWTGPDFSGLQEAMGNFASMTREKITSGSNLLTDPTVNNTRFWRNSVAVPSTDYNYSGRAGVANSLKLTSTGSTALTFYFTVDDQGSVQSIKCLPDDYFYVECYVRSNGTNATGTINLLAQISDSTGTNATQTLVLNSVTLTANGGPNAWTKLSKAYKIPSGYDGFTAGVQLPAGGTATGNKFYVDNMLIREETATMALQDGLYQALSGSTGATGSSADDVKQAAQQVGNAASTALNTANGATAAANGATGTANQAITLANGATAAANGATGTANQAITLANGATAAANGATGTANQAVTLANGATAAANGATGTANQAVTLANGATGTANQAVTLANGATALANGATGTANQAVTLANGATGTANTAVTKVNDTNIAIYNGYFGSGGTGATAEAQATIAAIKTKLTSGYTLQTLTYNAGMTTQRITINGSPTGGTFTLSYAGQTTGALAYNVAASGGSGATASVQNALVALSTIGAGNAVVTGSAGGPYQVTLSNIASPGPSAISAASSLTGGTSPSVTVQGTWSPPWTSGNEPAEFYAICFGSGGGGGKATASTLSTSNVTGGLGGAPGGYAASQITAATLTGTVVPYTVAAGGLGRTTGATSATSGAETSFGTYVTTSTGLYYATNILGYYSSNNSAPGAGGVGGTASVTSGVGLAYAGSSGGSTLLATGGNAAISGTPPGGLGIAGGSGGTAGLTGSTRAGGGGGGGGGSVIDSSKSNPVVVGGAGGNGGFPGGGAGGGGGAITSGGTSASGGNGGNGANGVIVLLWK